MAGAQQSSTPEGTGNTVFDAASNIASLLTDEGIFGTQDEGEAKQEHEAEEAEHSEEEHPEAHEESESEHEDESSESDEQHEDDEQDHAELPDDTKIRVGDEEVTLHELRRGFMREKDYTQKTQALAAEKRQFDQTATEQLTGMKGERDQLINMLGQASKLLEELRPVEPDWDKVLRETPEQYPILREQWRSYVEMQQGLEGRRRAEVERQMQHVTHEMQQYANEQVKLLKEKIPEWAKPEVAKADKELMYTFAEKNGYTKEEVDGVLDHRALIVLRKAAKYDELMSKKQAIKPTAPKNAPRVAAPGNGGANRTGKQQETIRAKQRLAKTGRTSDAAAAIFSILDED